ncbi:MAG: SMC-Scp complex subunit ScpB [Candidatus Sumerlaeota bacterium]|nr:SMC-Scp complex subunit ScpB [Candidatus Sumerlaeota bacterium]
MKKPAPAKASKTEKTETKRRGCPRKQTESADQIVIAAEAPAPQETPSPQSAESTTIAQEAPEESAPEAQLPEAQAVEPQAEGEPAYEPQAEKEEPSEPEAVAEEADKQEAEKHKAEDDQADEEESTEEESDEEEAENEKQAPIPPITSPQQAKAILEGLLFTTTEPMPTKRLLKIIHPMDEDGLKALLAELDRDYEGRGLKIMEVAGGWLMATRSEYADWIMALHKGRRRRSLTKIMLETLAIVAYRQPVIKAEIDAIRGVDSSGVLRTLLDMELVDARDRREVIGRPMQYRTTQNFLKAFGLNSLADLPSIGDLREMYAQPEPPQEAPQDVSASAPSAIMETEKATEDWDKESGEKAADEEEANEKDKERTDWEDEEEDEEEDDENGGEDVDDDDDEDGEEDEDDEDDKDDEEDDDDDEDMDEDDEEEDEDRGSSKP